MNWNPEDDAVYIVKGDCRDILPTISNIDAVITDPPYELGFMGKDWDKKGTSFQTETWRLILNACKPGAHLLAMGGDRTHHRLMIAIEDAGWEIRDTVMWVYGQGFPKSLDVSKAIDKMAGAKREVVGKSTTYRPNSGAVEGYLGTNHFKQSDSMEFITTPTTPAARQWEGWGTGLKPAWEPIILARKPLEGTVAENVLKYGTGAINIDGCRIPTDWATDSTKRGWQGGNTSLTFDGGIAPIHPASTPGHQRISHPNPQGRFPANLILTYPENEYMLRDDVTPEQLHKLAEWIMRIPNSECVVCSKPLYRRPYEKKARYFACKDCREKAKHLYPVTDKQKEALAMGRVKGTNHLEGISKSVESNCKRSQSHKQWCAENPDEVKARGAKTQGSNHYNWKGGNSRLNTSIRLMTENRKWMDAIKLRDGICLVCSIDNDLESHHVIPLAVLIEEHGIKNREQARNCPALWDLDNGRMLCAKHHYQVHGRRYAD